jgi:hypothetical protein
VTYAYRDLADLIAAGAQAASTPLTVYSTPAGSIKAPGVLIQADEPWWTPESFDFYRERYLVIAFVVASAPSSAYDALHDLVRLVWASLAGAEAWYLEDFGAPRQDDSTGSVYLAAAGRAFTRKPH